MIEVKGLNKVFSTKVKQNGKKIKKEIISVNDLNFKINKGEIVGFIGPNGAGKSTTIKMITGILHPTSGEITVNGLNPIKDRKKLAYKIGCMFGQKSQLWMHLPSIDTYKLLGTIYDIEDTKLQEKIDELTTLFNIKDIIKIPVRKLSLGQRIICEIVAIMLHEPEIIFLDEPTIGLDIVVKQKLRDAILKLNKEKNVTIFFTSHDIGDVESICKRIIIIDKGRIIKDENINTLKKEYFNNKILNITYEKDVTDVIFDIPVSVNGNSIMANISGKEDISVILNKFLAYGKITDFTMEDTPLEEIIYDIYASGG